MNSPLSICIAFAGTRKIAAGNLREVALRAKEVFDQDPWAQVLIFDDESSKLIEIDFRGTAEDLCQRISTMSCMETKMGEAAQPEEAEKRPGRPRLGVVGREVTLLPRHWEWLANQPGGASVALRKLVEQARLANRGRDRRRLAQEAAYRFLSAMAGNEPGFEEAIRALFAGDRERFHALAEPWPLDIRDHALRLADRAFGNA
jgi:hypothetical protein